ncbi:MAG: HAD-IC family P-type ATPase [Candidatus Thermoplasmatota archaeon]|nr:HAD-IC family P-type ATPase [Candidatus Thermoplasmatota archaeon]
MATGEGLKDPHLLTNTSVLEELDTKREGLSPQEVVSKRGRFGPNELEEGRKTPKWLKFLKQFTDVLVIVLLVAAVVTGIIDPTGIDWMVITAIVIINATIGYIQEEKAEDAIAKLKNMSSPKAVVIREGKKKEVDAQDLVPGDIIHIESGMRIPADSRLIEAHSMKVNEAALTGESMAVEKSSKKLTGEIPLAERTNMVYMTTAVETGRGIAVITGTGMATEIGKIAGMIQEVQGIDTPLQRRLRKLGSTLGILVLGICILMLGLEIWREFDHLSLEIAVELFETAVSLAVAAIPEGLPAVVTIALAIGLKTMASKNVIIRKLPVVETLGSATVICTDKTGTLTTGTMTADVLHIGHRKIDISGTGYDPGGEFTIRGKKEDLGEGFENVMMASILCSDASLEMEDGRRKVIGDTTEGAIIVMAEKAGYDPKKQRMKDPREDEIPFDAERKMMSTVHNIEGELVGYTKGAPESVLGICDRELNREGEIPLSSIRKKEIIALTEKMAMKGYRTLGFSWSPEGRMEDRMVFLGIVGIKDKMRPEAKKAVSTAKRAGIRPIMITGDHKLTAAAIGKEIGLIRRNSEAKSCRDLDDMDEEEFKLTLSNVSVYARASPEHKVRIVKGLKEMGEIVAMTGDGVNDAPALKIAEIGVAMGITGTDVSKEASDMIITDDNFSSIVSAVEEGRSIYDNIRKVIQFLLSSNMGEVMVMLIAIIVGWPLPLIALQILWMNLVTDSFPALALVTEPKEPGIMKRRPRDPKESAITKDMIVSIFVSAGIITIGTLAVFWYDHFFMDRSIEHARTMALTTMVFFQMWTAIACRSTTHTMAEIGWFSNRKLLFAIGGAVALMIPVIYIPFVQNVFGTCGIGVIEWVEILVISVFGLIAVETWEQVNRKYFHFGVGS